MDTENTPELTPEDAVLDTEPTQDVADEFTEAGSGDESVAESSTPPAEQTSAAKPAWDTERQRADQAEANYRKLQREKAELDYKTQEAERRIAELEGRLSEFAKANEVNLDDLEAEFVDPAAYKVIKSMKAKLTELENIASDYRKQDEERRKAERERQLESEREKAKNEIIADIETEFGQQYRNEALKMADEICNKRGYPPQDRYEAAKILRSCYKEVAASKGKSASSGKQFVQTDTGKNTVTAKAKEDIKPGTLREVMAQMRAKAGL